MKRSDILAGVAAATAAVVVVASVFGLGIAGMALTTPEPPRYAFEVGDVACDPFTAQLVQIRSQHVTDQGPGYDGRWLDGTEHRYVEGELHRPLALCYDPD